MTFKTPHVDCLWRLAVTSAALLRNSLVNSNKHVPIIKHWAPLVIHCDAAHARWLGKPLEERLVFEGPQRTNRHMTGCLFMSLISPPAPLCLVPPGEADPLLIYWANLEPNSSSQVFWLCAGSLRCIRLHHSWCRRLCRHTSNCELCFCASLSTFWGSVMLFLFSISGWDSDLFQKTKKSNQIYSVT